MREISPCKLSAGPGGPPDSGGRGDTRLLRSPQGVGMEGRGGVRILRTSLG